MSCIFLSCPALRYHLYTMEAQITGLPQTDFTTLESDSQSQDVSKTLRVSMASVSMVGHGQRGSRSAVCNVSKTMALVHGTPDAANVCTSDHSHKHDGSKCWPLAPYVHDASSAP
eukprot:3454549-Amphidinium_carterae.1